MLFTIQLNLTLWPEIYSIKPTLKKVSKYENKFAKLQKKAAEFNFRNQLKTVKKKEFTMDEEEPGVSSHAHEIAHRTFSKASSSSNLQIVAAGI